MNINAINQRQYGNAFCLASCYLAAAQYYYGSGVSMATLQNANKVASNDYVNSWGLYVNRSSEYAFKISGIQQAINAGTPVIIKGTSSAGTHYVIAYSYSGNTIYVMDPWNGVYGTLYNTTLKTASGYYVCTRA